MFRTAINIWIIIGIALAIVLLLSIVIILVLKNKNKKIRVDSSFIDNILNYLGGVNNLLSTEVENGRLRLKVNDLDVVNFDGLKSMTESGVFVTGDCVKILFKTDSKLIKEELDKKIK